jgi:hypothetical protein
MTGGSIIRKLASRRDVRGKWVFMCRKGFQISFRVSGLFACYGLINVKISS